MLAVSKHLLLIVKSLGARTDEKKKKHTRIHNPHAKQSHCLQVQLTETATETSTINTKAREERDEMCQKAFRKDFEKPKHTF